MIEKLKPLKNFGIHEAMDQHDKINEIIDYLNSEKLGNHWKIMKKLREKEGLI